MPKRPWPAAAHAADRGRLFAGLLAIRPACPVCGLDFSGADTGDAFAVPILIVLGAIIVGAAFWVDSRFAPPLWVHAILWPPITGVLVILMTRYLKKLLCRAAVSDAAG